MVDDNGVYVTNYDKILNLTSIRGVQYNPVNIALMIVHEGKYVNENYQYYDFLRSNLDWLVDNMDEKGRWPIEFDNHISKRINKAPWYSGLAQGLGVSALIRGFIIFDDKKYLRAAKQAVEPMLTNVRDGGTVSSESVYGDVIEEYPFPDDNIHVLNGYLYSLIGLYELSNFDSQYKVLLNKHLTTLSLIIDEYDLPGGWSAYSLDSPTFRNHANYANPMYHQLHIAQLDFFCKKTDFVKFCEKAKQYHEYSDSVASLFVHVSYVMFKDFVKVYKGLRNVL